MVREDKFSSNFQRMIDRPEELLEALLADPDAFEEEVRREEQHNVRATAAIPTDGFLGFAMFDGQGHAVDLGEPEWVPRPASFDELLAEAQVRSSNGRLLCLATATDRLAFALWAPIEETSGWNLPSRIREACQQAPGGRLVLVAGGAAEPLEMAAAGFGLSDLQQRVVVAVVRIGSVREAARHLGIGYTTARQTMADVARRMALPNTPAVVRVIVSAAFGIMPGEFDEEALLADMLRITPRQAKVALLVSSGRSREEVAHAVGCGLAVIKKELELLYANFGVQSATELARLIVEVKALRLFARSIDGAPGFLAAAIEPTRFAMRPQTMELIGWSDYGPASGKPVLVVHSNWSCRAVPRPLLVELQKRGWRPIAIDRPGFGATHLGRSSREDPFGQAIADTLQILDACRIPRVAIIAKCGAQFVHALKQAVPDRVGPVVLVSPSPQTTPDGRRVGLVGMIKETYMRRPRLIELFFRMICTQFTMPRVEQLTRAIVKESPEDTALCDDPQFIRDRFRALRPMSTGNLAGGIIEEHVISLGLDRLAPLDVDDWVVLQGDKDIHNSFAEVERYWRQVLPRTPILCVEGGGRFMTSSSPDLIAGHLEVLAAK
ncbi:alpha/beta fold hydrolase [Alteraurantiacibacter buctensis]|uniref:Alpha/beta fold hydrolase n=1 Tax=Alteraurantiacibacter buctensis TaxID=1503981 RepID=A0A844YXX9_9SPHN|nr:alpha/beta fold hydrolase [Alteraurantiacibacter buctensis]MXO70937.1 alpha/beta fold hydrolase [Alteraurantiacibacter buctensis]